MTLTPEPFSAPDAVVYRGDCIEVMAQMPDCSIDAIVCDPPYGLEFMGKDWDKFGGGGARSRATAGMSPPGIGERERDWPSFLGGLSPRCTTCGKSQRGGSPCRCEHPTFTDERGPRLRAFQVWCEQWAIEALRILKPGGHLAAFGGTRTFHRLTCGIEDAGFEIRDCLAWMYGSGFPKSLDVSKAIDKAAGAQITAPATEEAQRWEGWGTALKPAWEPIILARKPLIGTVASNVLTHGTGALNIDASRIEAHGADLGGGRVSSKADGWDRPWKHDAEAVAAAHERGAAAVAKAEQLGRWPANVVLDEHAAAVLDAQTGELSSGFMPAGTQREGIGYHGGLGTTVQHDTIGDSGGASRFFYTSKASKADRGEGNLHPTVKPTDLMQWLVRLVTPPGGTVLDPFAGSGTTGVAAIIEGFPCVLIEREPEYVEIIRRHLTEGNIQPSLLGGAA